MSRRRGAQEGLNRLLDIVRKRMNHQGIWEGKSIVGDLARSLELSKATIRTYITMLECLEVLSVKYDVRGPSTKILSRIELHKQNCTIVKKNSSVVVVESRK